MADLSCRNQGIYIPQYRDEGISRNTTVQGLEANPSMESRKEKKLRQKKKNTIKRFILLVENLKLYS